jgi:hypothetical protein
MSLIYQPIVEKKRGYKMAKKRRETKVVVGKPDKNTINAGRLSRATIKLKYIRSIASDFDKSYKTAKIYNPKLTEDTFAKKILEQEQKLAGEINNIRSGFNYPTHEKIIDPEHPGGDFGPDIREITPEMVKGMKVDADFIAGILQREGRPIDISTECTTEQVLALPENTIIKVPVILPEFDQTNYSDDMSNIDSPTQDYFGILYNQCFIDVTGLDYLLADDFRTYSVLTFTSFEACCDGTMSYQYRGQNSFTPFVEGYMARICVRIKSKFRIQGDGDDPGALWYWKPVTGACAIEYHNDVPRYQTFSDSGSINIQAGQVAKLFVALEVEMLTHGGRCSFSQGGNDPEGNLLITAPTAANNAGVLLTFEPDS